MTADPNPAVTNADKLKCAAREFAYRDRVYPRWVEAGRMSQAKADRELAVMAAIMADYSKLVMDEAERGRLL